MTSRVEPQQQALVVEVHAAPQVPPRVPPLIEQLRLGGGVHERALRHGCLDPGRRAGQRVAGLRGGADSGASGEHEARNRVSLSVDPQQLRPAWAEIIARGQPGGATELAVPGMHEFVRQQVRVVLPLRVVDPPAFVAAIVARLVMLQAEVRGVVR